MTTQLEIDFIQWTKLKWITVSEFVLALLSKWKNSISSGTEYYLKNQNLNSLLQAKKLLDYLYTFKKNHVSEIEILTSDIKKENRLKIMYADESKKDELKLQCWREKTSSLIRNYVCVTIFAVIFLLLIQQPDEVLWAETLIWRIFISAAVAWIGTYILGFFIIIFLELGYLEKRSEIIRGKIKKNSLASKVKLEIGRDFSNLELAITTDIEEQEINKIFDGYINHKKQREETENIKNINPYDFEKLVAMIFNYYGFTSKITKKSWDNGIDIILEKAGEKSAVQCKRQVANIGTPKVREFIWSLQFARIKKWFFVTTSNYSFESVKILDTIDSDIVLINIDILEKLIFHKNIQGDPLLFEKITKEWFNSIKKYAEINLDKKEEGQEKYKYIRKRYWKFTKKKS